MEIACLVSFGRFFLFQTVFIFSFGKLLADPFSFFFHLGSGNTGFAEFAEVLHCLISKIFGFLNNVGCSGICLTNDPVALCIQLFLLVLEFGLETLHLAAVRSNLFPLFFDGLAALFQISKEIFKRFILLGQMRFGILDDIIRKAEFFGNRESITFSRNTDQKMVSRAQCLHVKFTAGIFYSRSRKSKYLQFAVVCRCHSADSTVMQM